MRALDIFCVRFFCIRTLFFFELFFTTIFIFRTFVHSGCILAELLSMQQESMPTTDDREPLFPGTWLSLEVMFWVFTYDIKRDICRCLSNYKWFGGRKKSNTGVGLWLSLDVLCLGVHVCY